MSLKTQLVALFAFLWVGIGQAQNKFSEGVINYLITVENSKDPSAAFLHNSTLTALFKGNLNKVKLDMMGGLIFVNMVMDDAKKEGLMLMDMMAKRQAVTMSKSDFDQASSQAPKISSSNETKTIAGYLCKKSTFKTPEGQQVSVYTTEDIQPKNSSFLQKMVGNLKGFPLGMETALPDGGKLKIWAKDISKKSPDKSEFNLKIPQGYEVTTLQELQKSAGGKGGLFGR